MNIDTKTYVAPKEGYFNKVTKKEKIVIGDTCRKSNYDIIRKINRLIHKKDWSTYTISRNGIIYQHFKPDYYSNFLEDNNLNKKIISILLENSSFICYSNTSGKALNWLNEDCSQYQIYERKWKGYDYWEKYPVKQLDSLKFLIKNLTNKYLISPDIVETNSIISGIEKKKNIFTRSNLTTEAYDVNPSFDFNYIK